METRESSYYADILVLVDGWRWRLAQFDFRSFFAPASCPPALLPVAAAGIQPVTTAPSRLSGNRRARRQHASARQGQKVA
jgi:hypothetical protein